MTLLSLFRARQRLHEALLKEEARSRPDHRGPVRLRTARQGDWAFVWSTEPDTMYELRTVLASQVVFDVGDAAKRNPDKDAAWRTIVKQTHALWDVLNDRGIHYWGSLSGGWGTHTEVFIEPLDGEGNEFRRAFADAVVALVSERLLDDVDGEGFDTDPALLAPEWRSRLVREFGAVKRSFGTEKTLWTVGPGPYKPLADTRTETYKQASGIVVPTALVLNRAGPGILHEGIRSAFGGSCPKTFECLKEPDICARCPASH